MNLVFTIYGMKFILPVFTNEPPQEEVISLKGENYFNLVKRVERLEAEVGRLEAGIDRLEAENAKLREENAELKRCLGLNSTNSSKPPSSDPPSMKYPPRTSTGRRPGKQEGAKGHRRFFLEPTEIIDHRPKMCRHCGIDIPPDIPVSGSYQRRQQVEIPPIKPIVTEHHYHSIRCPKCGKLIREEVKEEHKPCCGPHLASLIAMLTAVHNLPRRRIDQLLKDILGTSAWELSTTAFMK